MKIIIQILTLVLFFGCGNNPSSEIKLNKNSDMEKRLGKETIELEFIPDSSYVKYWCSSEILKKTSESIDKLELIMVAEFLATFHKDCRDNPKYSKWSNELLFEVAIKSPNFLLQLLHKNDSLDKTLIKSKFESPINNSIELDEIIKKIESANSPLAIKNEVIEALRKAKSAF